MSRHASCSSSSSTGSRRLLTSPLERDKSFSNKYEPGEVLGKGGSGIVWTCRRRATGEECAVKVFDHRRRSIPKAAIQKEILILRALKGQHRGIVQLEEVLLGEHATFLIFELCKGGDLLDLLTKRGKLHEASAKLVFRQLASALRFCHSLGVVHRDIKLENIFFKDSAACLYHPFFDKSLASDVLSTPTEASIPALSRSASSSQFMEDAASQSAGRPAAGSEKGSACGPVCKLGDFGLSVVLDPGCTTTGQRGTPSYTAPEMLQGRHYGRRIDVWSLGVVLYAMLTGELPFRGSDKADRVGLKDAILRKKLDFQDGKLWQGVSEEAKHLVQWMLEREPSRRIRSSELEDHPWLTRSHPPLLLPAPRLLPLHPSSAGPQDLLNSAPQVSVLRVSEKNAADVGATANEVVLRGRAQNTAEKRMREVHGITEEVCNEEQDHAEQQELVAELEIGYEEGHESEVVEELVQGRAEAELVQGRAEAEDEDAVSRELAVVEGNQPLQTNRKGRKAKKNPVSLLGSFLRMCWK